MTDVNCFTSEHTTPTKNVLSDAATPTSPFILRAPPSAKSKLILQNMEEVLNSVKQKHREKHRRKREEKRRAAQQAEAEQAQHTPTTTASTAKTQTTVKSNGRHVPKDRPQPLREKTARENAKRKSSTPKAEAAVAAAAAAVDQQQTSIRQHFVKTDLQQPVKAKPTTNVFELMMNARNRSIGSNANGQSPEQEVPLTFEQTVGTPLSKRKQLLQDWNERKGGAKRRLADESRGEYIEKQMEHRAKRLKKMLTQPEQASSKKPETQLNQTLPVKRGRGRPRRVSEDVSRTPVPEKHNQIADEETVEFLAKLSSPTKKRDSLLGYFAKVESPKNQIESDKTEPLEQPVKLAEQTLETPRMRRSRGTKSVHTTAALAEGTIQGTTPTGRPRRSCASKARYDYDLEASPTKAKATTTAAAAPADESIETIDLDSSNTMETPKKLAPLFMKQLPKPSPDPSMLRARREFLQSGVPERLKQEQLRQKSNEQYYEENYQLFPRIAHVASVGYARAAATPHSHGAFALKQEVALETNVDVAAARKCNMGSITSCNAADYVPPAGKQRQPTAFSWTPLPLLANKRALVKNWKAVFDRFPTFKCYNQMREKYRHFSAIDAAQDTQPMGESFVVTRRTRRSLEEQQRQQQLEQGGEADKPPAMAPNGELLFTEKYKPLLFEQVLVNLTPVQELRDFLAHWNGASNRNAPTLDDSSMEFGNDSSSMGINCNTTVLLGPCSSGKTNAVFALANDMNFNVLEVNAGMKRTGKKLIQELQEATQSHQIRKDAKAAVAAAPTQQLLQKLQLNGLKTKRQQGDDEVRKSLILIEDADILFDNTDAGFADAIHTLAASSKRPVIIVATDPNCAHLQRLMQQNTIRFQAPNALNISRFLAVLSLMENCPIELDELISLYLYNKQNLRKTLMELQFFVQSGGDEPSKRLQQQVPGKSSSRSPIKSARLASLDGVHIHQRLFEFYTCAQNVQFSIPFPVNFQILRLNLNEFLRHSTRLQEQDQHTPAAVAAAKSSPSGVAGKRKSRSPKKTWLSTATHQPNKTTVQAPLETLASFYEYLSTATLLDARLEQQQNDRLQPNLAEELAHTLVERAVNTSLAAKDYAYNLFDKPKQRHNLVDQLGSCTLRTYCARSLDFEPALRAICRSEKERASVERRSSRFYHYLRNHTINNLTSFATDLYDEACNVLHEPAEQGSPKS